MSISCLKNSVEKQHQLLNDTFLKELQSYNFLGFRPSQKIEIVQYFSIKFLRGGVFCVKTLNFEKQTKK